MDNVKYRIIQYHYDTTLDSNEDVQVDPTILVADNEMDAAEICELMNKSFELGNTKTDKSWYSFGFEIDEGWVLPQ